MLISTVSILTSVTPLTPLIWEISSSTEYHCRARRYTDVSAYPLCVESTKENEPDLTCSDGSRAIPSPLQPIQPFRRLGIRFIPLSSHG